MIGALAALFALWLAGLGLLALVSTEPERWPPVGRLGLAFGLGLLAVPHALFVASLLGVTPAWWIGLFLTLALWAAALSLRGARGLRALLDPGAAEPPRPAWRLGVEAGLVATIAASCVLAGWLALEEPLHRERGFHLVLDVLPRNSFRARAFGVRFE